MLFAQIRNFVPAPRQSEQPKRYVGRHRVPEPIEAPDPRPEPAGEVEPDPVEV